MSEGMLRFAVAGALTTSLLLAALPASAYCRTTTCDPEKEVCRVDGNGCLLDGLPLFWPDLCTSFGVQVDGSPLRGITYARAEEAARRAFQTWISADCGSRRTPSIGIVARGEIYCDKIEYNHDSEPGALEQKIAGPNANVILFRDTDWPYLDVSKTIALTTITFSVSTGEILDADIEVNARDFELTTGDVEVRNDLQSVLTHEVGHFLGLAHSRISGATMNADYDKGDTKFRALSLDDRAAVCEVYPPVALAPVASSEQGNPAQGPAQSTAEENPAAVDCTGEEPRYGFSRYCGEAVLADGCWVTAPGTGAGRISWAAALLAGLFGVFGTRRRWVTAR